MQFTIEEEIFQLCPQPGADVVITIVNSTLVIHLAIINRLGLLQRPIKRSYA